MSLVAPENLNLKPKNMKTLFLISALVVFAVYGCGPTAQEAADYNDEIVAHQKLVMEKITELDNAIGNFDGSQMDKTFDIVNSTVDKALEEMNSMENFNGEESLKKAAVSYFETFKVLLGEFYPKLMEVFRLPPDNYTSTEKRIADSIQLIINTKHKESQTVLINAQSEFAKKHNFELE